MATQPTNSSTHTARTTQSQNNATKAKNEMLAQIEKEARALIIRWEDSFSQKENSEENSIIDSQENEATKITSTLLEQPSTKEKNKQERDHYQSFFEALLSTQKDMIKISGKQMAVYYVFYHEAKATLGNKPSKQETASKNVTKYIELFAKNNELNKIDLAVFAGLGDYLTKQALPQETQKGRTTSLENSALEKLAALIKSAQKNDPKNRNLPQVAMFITRALNAKSKQEQQINLSHAGKIIETRCENTHLINFSNFMYCFYVIKPDV